MISLTGKHVEAMLGPIDANNFFDKTGNYPDVPLMSKDFFNEFDNHTNILAIYAGYMPGPAGLNIVNCPIQLLIDYIKENYKDGYTLIFDNLFEGGIDIVVHRIHTIIDLLHINPSMVYYLVGAINGREEYEKFCIRNNITSRIHIYSANVWEYSLKCAAIKMIEPVFVIKTRKKLFLSFNRVTRLHRLALVCLLQDAGLVDRSFYSFFLDATHGHIELEKSKEIFKTALRYRIKDTELSTILLDSLERNESKFPLKLNIDKTYNKNYIDDNDRILFNESYFSLVTETFFFDYTRNHDGKIMDETSVFFTEKIFKPISMKHPFIIASRPYSLYHLRQIGYKTFHPYINEEYDIIDNNEQRLLAIVEEIKRLSTYSDSDWIIWQENIKDIVEYNYSIFMNKQLKDYAKERE